MMFKTLYTVPYKEFINPSSFSIHTGSKLNKTDKIVINIIENKHHIV